MTPCDLLILAANPRGEDPDFLERRGQQIREALLQGPRGRAIRTLVERLSRTDEVRERLKQSQPRIVHIIDESSTGEVVLEDNHGKRSPLTGQELGDLFLGVGLQTECLVLEGCYSIELLDSVVPHVRCLVGTPKDALPGATLRFFDAFYRGLASGRHYYNAFEHARNDVEGAGNSGDLTPRFNTQDFTIFDPPPKRGRGPRSRLYPLWYGTNRRPNPKGLAPGFTGEMDDHVHYGCCSVGVPESRKIGQIGSSFLARFLSGNDDRLKLVQDTLIELSEVHFWDSFQAALLQRKMGERSAVVFIHGYNVSFENAALRAAQIGFDLQVPGVMAFFSWPSKGTYLGYTADQDTVDASEAHLTEFLTRFARETGAESVHILAHSMGNRALLRSMKEIIGQASLASKKPFDQIFLAAPDINAALFRQYARHIETAAHRATLYVSSRDKALASSGFLHDNPRAGYLPPIMIVDGIDTVEVSSIDLSFLGHGSFDARAILTDINILINGDRKPELRIGIEGAKTEDGRDYWILQS